MQRRTRQLQFARANQFLPRLLRCGPLPLADGAVILDIIFVLAELPDQKGVPLVVKARVGFQNLGGIRPGLRKKYAVPGKRRD